MRPLTTGTPRLRPYLLATALAIGSSLHAQTPSFESASVKPAAPDAPQQGLGFMIGLSRHLPPHGLLTMTGPLPPFIVYAYGIQDEVEARAMRARLPEWAQHQKFAIVARAPQDNPTDEQLRGMLRSLLEERFALQAHRERHMGAVNLLTLERPGTTGPQLKLHDPAAVCQLQGAVNVAPDPGKPTPILCGLDILRKEGGIMRVTMVDVTLPEACTLLGGLGGVLGGRGMNPVVDNTGLPGRYDLAFEFHIENADGTQPGNDAGGPTFTGALEKQLGLKLNRGTGPIEDLIIDHIAQPTPD